MSPTTRFRRLGAAGCLAAGPALLLAATAVAPWNNESPDAAMLRTVETHRDAVLAGDMLAFLATLALVAGSLGAARLLCRTAPRLALAGGVVSVVGWTAGMGLVGVDQILVSVAGPGVRDIAGPAVENRAGWVLAVMFATFLAGHVLGLITLGVAALHGRSVPMWAGAALIAAPIMEIVAYSAADAKAVALVAYALMTVGLGAVAARIATTADVEWDDTRPRERERRVRDSIEVAA